MTTLPVTWNHVTSFPVTWLPTRAIYSLVGSQTHSMRKFFGNVSASSSYEQRLVGSQTHSICQLSAFYSHFQVTSGQMTSFPVTWLPPPASYSIVASQPHSIRQFSTVYIHFQVIPGKWHQFRVTSDHLRSPDVLLCHVTASCELQPSRK